MSEEKKKRVRKERKKRTGVVCGLLGISLSLSMLVGVGFCDVVATGRKIVPTVSTGSVLDRFVPAKAYESKDETISFFGQATKAFSQTADQEYTSYTLNYKANLENSKDGLAYHNRWKDVVAEVDKDYTHVTIVDRETEGTYYRRTVREYYIVKTGEHAGKTWGRYLEKDQSVGDVDLLGTGDWTLLKGTLKNEMSSALALLVDAQFGEYEFIQNRFAYTLTKGTKGGNGYLKAGKTPTLTFSYVFNGEADETGHHEWKCSQLNATKVFVPQSLLEVMGGEV